jgi:hypothetical protein
MLICGLEKIQSENDTSLAKYLSKLKNIVEIISNNIKKHKNQ